MSLATGSLGSLELGGNFSTLNLITSNDNNFDAVVKDIAMASGFVTKVSTGSILSQTSLLPQNN